MPIMLWCKTSCLLPGSIRLTSLFIILKIHDIKRIKCISVCLKMISAAANTPGNLLVLNYF
jgi:hypothetical protein